jgi:hypothetical protein
VALIVTDETQGYDLVLGVDYTVDWVLQTFTISRSSMRVANKDQLGIYVYELGGGNQIFKGVYNGASVVRTLTVPVEYPLIQEFVIFVNGVYLSNSGYSYSTGSINNTTTITFNSTYTITDFISLVAISPTTINNVTTNYSWSAPVTQVIRASGALTYNLSNSLLYTNSVNAIVNVDGIRARTPAGIVYVGDNITTVFTVAQRLGINQGSIQSSDVNVYFNDILQSASLYTVSPLTAGTTVTFNTAPAADIRIYISVSTGAQVTIDPTSKTLTFNGTSGLIPRNGQNITATTWNDTREQRLLTQVFVGPVVEGITISEGFDTTDFDQGTVTNESGSYNYTTGSTISVNNLVLQETINDTSRLWVTLNGKVLNPDIDFILENNTIILSYGTLQSTDVVIATQTTNSVVPEALEFRLFQDMRGVQATYRMTPTSTTTLKQAVTMSDDIIYVINASTLTIPNFLANIWGVITIDGERIMYRNIDFENNTVSSLLRGTAGTAAAAHLAGAEVYDESRGNLLPAQFQNYVVSNTTLADGTTTIFEAVDISLSGSSSVTWVEADTYSGATTVNAGGSYYYAKQDVPANTTITNTTYWQPLNAAVQVYVGGALQTSGYTFTSENPVIIEFSTAPLSGSNVIILINRGVTWYQQGVDTASNGIPLQETTTPAAQFLQGN